MSPLENKALNLLADNDNLIIKTADKGGGIVIQKRDDNRLLADKLTYKKLPRDPLPEYKDEINILIKQATRTNIGSSLFRDF